LRNVQLEGMEPQRLAAGPATAFTIKAGFAADAANDG
jgi:hypothetical protein